MKLLLVAAVLAACGPGLRQVPESTVTHDFATMFARASQTGDVATVRKMMGPHVMLGGLWFPDATCQKEFASPGEIGGGRLDELARCLTTVKLAVSPRKDSLADVAVLTYEPGFEVEARFIDKVDGPRLSWIGYEARKDIVDALPTISPEALEALRTGGQRDPAVTGLDGAPGDEHPYAWVKTCIDTEGKVTGTHVREASSLRAARAFSAASADWTFRPFAPWGQPLPVCALVLVAKPLAEALVHARIPFPARTPDNRVMIAPTVLHRLAGQTLVVPDDETKTRIQKAGVSRVIGTFQFCVDEVGRVTDLSMLRSTGFPRYDGTILRAISQWAYAPYLDEGKPVAVCTAVTFIYSQR
jgi:TonB family protein